VQIRNSSALVDQSEEFIPKTVTTN